MSEGWILFTIMWNFVMLIWLSYVSVSFVHKLDTKRIAEREANWIMETHMAKIHKMEKKCDFFPIKSDES